MTYLLHGTQLFCLPRTPVQLLIGSHVENNKLQSSLLTGWADATELYWASSPDN